MLALRSDLPPCSLAPRSSFLAPRGMTLIELLIVIIIITTLVSAAIPLMAPTNDDRRLREASRAVNSFFAAAQARAISIQRPVGVGIKRLSKDTLKPEDNSVSIELYYVEQPTPFVGFNEQSQVRVAFNSPPVAGSYASNSVLLQFVVPGTNNSTTADNLPEGWDRETPAFPPSTIRPGDVLVVNGTRFQLVGSTFDSELKLDPSKTFYDPITGNPDGQIVAIPLNDTGQMIDVRYDNAGYPLGSDRAGFAAAPAKPPAPYWTNPAPYKILRQPMKTSAEPLQLPEGTAIDLRASGLGDSAYFFTPPTVADSQGVNNSDDILIMFAPEGRVSRLILNPNGVDPTFKPPFDQPIVDNVFLLIGKRENCPPPDVGIDKTLNTSTIPGSGVANRESLLTEMKKPVNWLRGESRWIVIGSQSGRVVTVENAFVDPAAIASHPAASSIQNTEDLRNLQIAGAPQFGAATAIPGAREFIKEMKQLGGR